MPRSHNCTSPTSPGVGRTFGRRPHKSLCFFCLAICFIAAFYLAACTQDANAATETTSTWPLGVAKDCCYHPQPSTRLSLSLIHIVPRHLGVGWGVWACACAAATEDARGAVAGRGLSNIGHRSICWKDRIHSLFIDLYKREPPFRSWPQLWRTSLSSALDSL